MNLKNLFKTSLTKTIGQLFTGNKDKASILEEAEELLILSDISTTLVRRMVENVRKNTKASVTREEFIGELKKEIKAVFNGAAARQESVGAAGPGKEIIVMVGINGSGKTTSTAKLAHYFHTQGRKTLMSAADTFRAAGSSQLSLWGERLGIPVIGGDRGADPGSVVYNSLASFQSRDYDVLVVDTAGRVQTRDNLMKELEKLTKIVRKFYPGGPDQTLLVIDATMGQNTLEQARRFREFSGITGVFLSKIDGTAKGGTVINIVDELKIPVKFVGTGEGQADIELFSVDDFVDSLFGE